MSMLVNILAQEGFTYDSFDIQQCTDNKGYNVNCRKQRPELVNKNAKLKNCELLELRADSTENSHQYYG